MIGIDIHTKSAMSIFNVTEDQVTKIQREYAKTINFALVYGMARPKPAPQPNSNQEFTQ